MTFLLFSSNVEKVGGGLNIGVKSEKKEKSGSSAEAATEHKVRIRYSPGAGSQIYIEIQNLFIAQLLITLNEISINSDSRKPPVLS